MILRDDFQQNSLQWLIARSGIPTASEFDQLVTSDWKARTGEMPRTYLARKLAERWFAGPLPGFCTVDMEIGKILEGEAIPTYEWETGEKVQRVGFITTDDGRIGCSPDGLIGDDCGIEIKSPRPETHVSYLLDGSLPKAYAPQVYGSMLVTGRPRWKFMSYSRRLPPLILTIERDEAILNALQTALNKFLLALDAAYARLEELNGGPPHRPQPQTAVVNEISDDIIP